MNPEHPGYELDPELVFGDEPIDDEHLEGLRHQIATLRADFEHAAPPAPRADLARLFEARPDGTDAHGAQDADQDADPAAIVPIEHARSRRQSRIPRRLAIAVAAVVGAASVTTGLAAANVLPGPVQRAVHDVLAHAGVHVPPSDPPRHSAPSTTVRSSTTTGNGGGTAPGGGANDPAAAGQPGATGLPALPSVTAPGSPLTTPPTLLPPLPLPGLPLPGLQLPGVTVPGVTVPGVTVPGVTRPRSGGSPTTTAPKVTTSAPRLPLPLPTLPPATLPPLTLPRLPPLTLPPLPPLIP
jgi:hypothetical protein